MSESWPEVSLEDVALDVTVGHVGPMASEYQPSGIPFLRSLNVEPFGINQNDLKFISPEFHRRLRKSALGPGDVVIVRTGKPGACAVVPDWMEEVNCSDVVIVRAGPRIRPLYITYLVNSIAASHVAAYTVGAVQQHFNVASARQIRFSLPPLSQQDGMIAVLSALDDKAALNQRTNDTLEAMARTIFKDWFVDFGPTRAKMEGRASYLSPDVWSVFPDRLDDEDKPEGWRFGVLSDVISEIETGSRPKGGVSGYQSGVPSIGAESIIRLGHFDYGKTKYVPDDFFATMSKGIVNSRDVLLYKDGGRPGEFEPHVTMFGDGFPFETFAINEHVYRIRADNTLGQNYLLFWLSEEAVKEEMRVGRNGFAEGGGRAIGVSWQRVYPFGSAGARQPTEPSTKGDHHVATACADD